MIGVTIDDVEDGTYTRKIPPLKKENRGKTETSKERKGKTEEIKRG